MSADSHVTEPADLWVERLERKYRHVAPRVVRDFKRDAYRFVAPGIIPFAIATGFGTGKSGAELKNHQTRGYEAARPGGWDPEQRIKDQDIDGVHAEILYPTHAMRLFSLPDAGLQQACFGIYNEWIAEFAACDPNRLHGLALISLHDAVHSIRELERGKKLGLKGAMIWGSTPPSEPSFATRAYDPFWHAAQELEMPVSLHAIAGGAPNVPTRHESHFARYMNVIHEVQNSLTDIVCSGVLERFPRLRIVSAENDSGWFPHFLFRIDHAYGKFGKLIAEPLPMPPSEYVRRQVYATFQEDPVGPHMYDLFGEDNYMWASDYPHADSTWPNSVKAIERALNRLPQPVMWKMVGDNASRLYRIGEPLNVAPATSPRILAVEFK
jgi:predicted TIM-barrel fold metal-dependent hydrolase